MKYKKILITGGAGFIGSHLADRLLNMDNEVIVYDNFDDFYQGKEGNVQHNLVDKNYKLIKGDILNYELLKSIMKGVDVIFHMAAQAGIRQCIMNPLKAHNVNVTGTLNVLMAAKENHVKKLVYASSSGIFGLLRYVPIDEDHPTNPNSPYGATKLAAEKYCLSFLEVYEMNIACLRYFSVYGPRGRPDQVIHAFSKAILEGKRPIIYGDGEQTRDFTFISDIVEATILTADKEEAQGVFNIGYGREIKINETFGIVSKALDMPEMKPQYEKTYRGDFPRTFADNSKARNFLGWEPKISIEEGVRLFVKWFIASQ